MLAFDYSIPSLSVRGRSGTPVAAIHLVGNTMPENSAASTQVGVLSVTNGTGTYTFSLTNSAGNKFKTAGTNGTNLQAGATATDFEAGSTQTIVVSATNGVDTPLSRSFNITITNVNETPTDIALSNASIPDNDTVGSIVGALSTTDPDVGDTFTYSLTDSASGKYAISGSNLIVNGTLTAGTDSITVRSTDFGGLTKDKTFSITVTASGGGGGGTAGQAIGLLLSLTKAS